MYVNAVDLREISERALHDPSPHVRWQAKQSWTH